MQGLREMKACLPSFALGPFAGAGSFWLVIASSIPIHLDIIVIALQVYSVIAHTDLTWEQKYYTLQQSEHALQ